jgi:DNA-binding response OmpR family regulator
MDNLTPTQQRIWDILKDGEPHSRMELKRAIDPYNPELCSKGNLDVHLTMLRKKIPDGFVIIARMLRPQCSKIQMFRRIPSPYNGRN